MIRARNLIGAASVAMLSALPLAAAAGPIGAIDGLFVLFFEYSAGVLAITLVSLHFCRSIANRTVRALARLAIVVMVATPVPAVDPYGTSTFAPAFLAALRYLNLGGGSAAQGLFAFAVPIAYLVAFAAFAPLVIAWVRLGEPYDRR